MHRQMVKRQEQKQNSLYHHHIPKRLTKSTLKGRQSTGLQNVSSSKEAKVEQCILRLKNTQLL